jgi:hypothetical protein
MINEEGLFCRTNSCQDFILTGRANEKFIQEGVYHAQKVDMFSFRYFCS